MATAFRADASDTIGNGHVMRCVTLADQLASQGEVCHFICRHLTKPARDAIGRGGHVLHELTIGDGRNDRSMPHAPWLACSWQDDADASISVGKRWDCNRVVVDHYAIDASWEAQLRQAGFKLIVIDDLADRPHDCNVLLDQNLHAEPYLRYEGLMARPAQMLLGPRYALLRADFSKGFLANISGGRVLVAFSGADTLHLTVLALQMLEDQRDVCVVINGQNVDRERVEGMCRQHGWPLHVDADDIPQLMSKAAIGVGAGGGMVWERAAVGLPSIAVIVADNQRQQVLNAAAAGMTLGLEGTSLDGKELRAAFYKLKNDPTLRQVMAGSARRIVDGKGRQRVAERLISKPVHMRVATSSDSEVLWRWRNDPAIRAVSRNSDEISLLNHQAWFDGVLAADHRHLLVGWDDSGDLGVVRFDRDETGAEISIYLVSNRLGQGRGPALLLAAERWLATRITAALTVRAQVLAGNRASEELFLSCGYTFTNGMYCKVLEGHHDKGV